MTSFLPTPPRPSIKINNNLLFKNNGTHKYVTNFKTPHPFPCCHHKCMVPKETSVMVTENLSSQIKSGSAAARFLFLLSCVINIGKKNPMLLLEIFQILYWN